MKDTLWESDPQSGRDHGSEFLRSSSPDFKLYSFTGTYDIYNFFPILHPGPCLNPRVFQKQIVYSHHSCVKVSPHFPVILEQII